MRAGPHPSPFLERLLQKKVPGTFWLVLGSAFIVTVGSLDLMSGPYTPLGALNIIPVVLISLLAGRWMGLVGVIGAATFAYLHAARILPHGLDSTTVAWNIGSPALTYVAMAELGAQLRSSFLRQSAMATMDYLTGLQNMRGFRQSAGQELARCNRAGGMISAAFIDCDNFKYVNDQKGHAEGDKLLRVVANVLRANLRPCDIPSRVGGDEFAILMPGADAVNAGTCMTRVRAALTQAMRERSWPVTFSVGLATMCPPPAGVDALLARIDGLQYRAKQGGKDRIEAEGGSVARTPVIAA